MRGGRGFRDFRPPPIGACALLPDGVFARGANEAPLAERLVALDPHLQRGVVHHADGCRPAGAGASGMGDEDEELVAERLLQGDVVAVGHAGVLEGVDDHHLGALAAAQACLQLLHRLAQEQEASVDVHHAVAEQALLHGQAGGFLEAVVCHVAVTAQLLAELHDEGALAVARVAPDEPHAAAFRLAEGVRPRALEGEDVLAHGEGFLDGECASERRHDSPPIRLVRCTAFFTRRRSNPQGSASRMTASMERRSVRPLAVQMA